MVYNGALYCFCILLNNTAHHAHVPISRVLFMQIIINYSNVLMTLKVLEKNHEYVQRKD